MKNTRETVKSFINRAIPEEMFIRIEANDMLPIRGTKKNIINRVDELYLLDFDIVDFNNITIRATYHSF